VLGDGVPRLATEDIIEARLGAALVAQAQKVLQRIDDLPAREEIDGDCPLSYKMGHYSGLSIGGSGWFV